MRVKFVRVVFVLAMIFISSAKAVLPVIDINAILQLTTQAGLLRDQLNSIKMQLLQLEQGRYQWSNAQNLIHQMGSILQQHQSLANSAANIDRQFRQRYPGYQPSKNFRQDYENNLTQTLDTFNGVLQSMGLSQKDFADENRRLQFLQQQTQNSKGQLQAIQASAQLASEEISQLQLLRQVMVAQTEAQTTYYASQIQQEASQQAQLSAILGAGNQELPSLKGSRDPIQLYPF